MQQQQGHAGIGSRAAGLIVVAPAPIALLLCLLPPLSLSLQVYDAIEDAAQVLFRQAAGAGERYLAHRCVCVCFGGGACGMFIVTCRKPGVSHSVPAGVLLQLHALIGMTEVHVVLDGWIPLMALCVCVHACVCAFVHIQAWW